MNYLWQKVQDKSQTGKEGKDAPHEDCLAPMDPPQSRTRSRAWSRRNLIREGARFTGLGEGGVGKGNGRGRDDIGEVFQADWGGGAYHDGIGRQLMVTCRGIKRSKRGLSEN